MSGNPGDQHGWLKSLEIGDTVVVDRGYHGRELATVDRVTATQIIVGKLRYRRKDGYVVGESSHWARQHIRRATPELISQITHETLVDKLSRIRRRDIEALPTETLQQAWELLQGGRNGSEAIRLTRGDFDKKVREGEFVEGPFIEQFGDGYGEPYNPHKRIWGRLKDGRNVESYT